MINGAWCSGGRRLPICQSPLRSCCKMEDLTPSVRGSSFAPPSVFTAHAALPPGGPSEGRQSNTAACALACGANAANPSASALKVSFTLFIRVPDQVSQRMPTIARMAMDCLMRRKPPPRLSLDILGVLLGLSFTSSVLTDRLSAHRKK